MLEITNLKKSFGKKEIITDITVTMENGVYGLLGPNGAGKTTFIRCIMGLYNYKGMIQYNGKKINNNIIRTGYLPQKFTTFPEMKVKEVMNYFCVLKGIKKKEIEPEIKRCLELVNLREEEGLKVSKLSGGMLRRLGIAQAVIGRPDVLIFDEPTAGLDIEERMRFKDIILKLGKESVIIISTHVVEDIETICDKIVVMHQGKILSCKPPAETAASAVGKIYNVRQDNLNKLSGKYWIEREYHWDGNVYCRILSEQPKQEELEPVMEITLEDGYMALIKGIK